MGELFQIHKGTSRVVLSSSLFPKVVVKVARIRLIAGCISLWKWKRFLLHRFPWKVYHRCLPTPAGFWWKGVVENWNEHNFYQENKHPLLQPTLFSMGLVNIQTRGQPLKYDSGKFRECLHRATNGAVAADGHHFDNINNFCFWNGLKMVDYGSPNTQRIIESCGAMIKEGFDREFGEIV